jgi:uncharacterized membrane protein (DUF2068 family)
MEHDSPNRRPTKRSVGLRTLAIAELIKGAIVLLLGFGVFHLMHNNLDDVAERVCQVFHVNPEGKLSNLFFELASHSSDRNLWVLALGAFVYATVRSIEGYGLWREREWAQWFELLSTGLYLPAELYWLRQNPSWLKVGVLIANGVILLFMVTLRVKQLVISLKGAELGRKPGFT